MAMAKACREMDCNDRNTTSLPGKPVWKTCRPSSLPGKPVWQRHEPTTIATRQACLGNLSPFKPNSETYLHRYVPK
eukprot:13368086-Alexandrium_andersonii.AAC.1